MSTPPHKVFHRARQSNICLCGLPKRTGHLFCLPCGCKIPRELRDQMRDQSFQRRLGGFLAAARHLGLDLQEELDLHAVFLSEGQLDGILLGACLQGKQIAVQALLDWARITNPQPMVASPELEEIVQ